MRRCGVERPKVKVIYVQGVNAIMDEAVWRCGLLVMLQYHECNCNMLWS